MARTLIGTATKPNGANGWESWSDTWNMGAELLAMPARGKLVNVGVWVAGVGQTATAYVCAWSASGILLAQSAAFTIAGRPEGSGQVDLYARDLIDPPVLDAGVQVLVGFWRDKNRSHQLTSRSAGSHRDKRAAATDADMTGAHTGGHGFGDYAIGCHAYLEPAAGVDVRRSGAFVDAEALQVRRSGAWVDADALQVRRGGTWIDAD